MINSGNGLLLKMDYADGGKGDKKRTFLVIRKYDESFHLLNISSVKGKERKLGFRNNKNIVRYNPPFLKKSFVKLDSLYIIPNTPGIEKVVLCNRRKMHPIQLKEIINSYEEYREKNKIFIKNVSIEELQENNPEISFECNSISHKGTIISESQEESNVI